MEVCSVRPFSIRARPLPGPGPSWPSRAAPPSAPWAVPTPAALPALNLVALDEEWKSLLSISSPCPVGTGLPAQACGGPLPFFGASFLWPGACGTWRHSKACLSFALGFPSDLDPRGSPFEGVRKESADAAATAAFVNKALLAHGSHSRLWTHCLWALPAAPSLVTSLHSLCLSQIPGLFPVCIQ